MSTRPTRSKDGHALTRQRAVHALHSVAVLCLACAGDSGGSTGTHRDGGRDALAAGSGGQSSRDASAAEAGLRDSASSPEASDGASGVDGHRPRPDADAGAPDGEGPATDGSTGCVTASGESLGPRILAALPIDNPNSALSFSLSIDTDEATDVRARIREASGPVDFELAPAGAPSSSHTVEVIGLHAATLHTIDVVATNARGCSSSTTLQYTTGALPGDLPDLQASVSDPSRMSPGVTLLSLSVWHTTEVPSFLVAVDEEGRIVWYRKWPRGINEAHQRQNGNLVFGDGDGIVEMDLMGRPVRTWTRATLGIDFQHHELHETPAGRLLSLTTVLRTIGGYPGGTGTTEYDVVGDSVFELDETGAQAGSWSLFDVLDPYVTNPTFDTASNDGIYPNSPNGTTKDWTHANAISVDPSDGGHVVSLRNFSWIVKVMPETPPRLVYRFGEGADVTLTSGEWFYGQHGVDVLGNGHLLMYDNGLGRPGVPADQLYSRAAEYSLSRAGDGGGWTAAQVWEYRETPDYFSPIWCDADELENGNVLVADVGRMTDPFAGLRAPTNLKWLRVVEVTHTTPPEKVFELVARKELSADFFGYSAYRAKRIGKLHP